VDGVSLRRTLAFLAAVVALVSQLQQGLSLGNFTEHGRQHLIERIVCRLDSTFSGASAEHFEAFEKAGLLVEALREPSVPEHALVSETGRRWQRIPLFLHLRALRS